MFVIDSLPRQIHDGVLSTIPILIFRPSWELSNRFVWFGFIADVLDDLCLGLFGFGFIADVLDNLCIGLCGLILISIKRCLINA